MKAYELYTADLASGEFIRRPTDRRGYYQALRQALKDEATGKDCPLLAHFAQQLGRSDAPCLYLLDAAAIWECHAMVVGGSRFALDLGQGFPFLVDGRRLLWSEVQRLSDSGTLPAAVADAELTARLEGLLIHMGARRGKAPVVNGRATLRTVPAPKAPAPAPAWKPALADDPAPADKPAPAGKAAPAEPVDREENARLWEENSRLRKENARLREENERLRKPAETRPGSVSADCDAVLHTAELVLRNRIGEAAAEACKVGGKLEQEIRKLAQLQNNVADLQRQLADAKTRQQIDTAQAEALRTQQREARQAAEAARADCEQAQRDAEASRKERAEAEACLNQARADLNACNTALRTLQKQLADTAAAVTLTRRQVEKLS